MRDIFSPIQGLLKVDSISVDNKIFQLHYKMTMFFLLACSLLVTQRQYFGDPIDCISDGGISDIADDYCWIHSTFTLPALNGGTVGHDVPHPGIGNVNGLNGEKHEIKHHTYYQWVSLFLALQALFFYLPHYIWKVCEGGKLKMLVKDLCSPMVENDVKEERKDMLVKYFKLNINSHNLYAYWFFGCEVLNFVNVILQIFLTNVFLGYSFTTYGKHVIEMSQQEITSRGDPMDMVFPKVGKCNFFKYGPGGSLEKHDALCVLPVNILNEKIFIFLWFWFIIVSVVTAVGLLYRIATFLPGFRKILLKTRSRLASSGTVDAVARRCQIGDWFLVYQLAKNMDPLIYTEFLGELVEKLQA